MERTPEQIYSLAKAQKMIMWCLLANFALNGLTMSLEPLGNTSAFNGPYGLAMTLSMIVVGLALLLVVLFVAPYYVYRLARELGYPLPFLWAPFVLVPLISLLLLIILSSNATKVLRAQGYKVGLMGANLKTIPMRATSEE